MVDRRQPRFRLDRGNLIAFAIGWGLMGLVLLAIIF